MKRKSALIFCFFLMWLFFACENTPVENDKVEFRQQLLRGAGGTVIIQKDTLNDPSLGGKKPKPPSGSGGGG